MSDEDSSDEISGPATNIPQLTLACMSLANDLESMLSLEEKEKLIKEHLMIYSTESIIPITQFQEGKN